MAYVGKIDFWYACAFRKLTLFLRTYSLALAAHRTVVVAPHLILAIGSLRFWPKSSRSNPMVLPHRHSMTSSNFRKEYREPEDDCNTFLVLDCEYERARHSMDLNSSFLDVLRRHCHA